MIDLIDEKPEARIDPHWCYENPREAAYEIEKYMAIAEGLQRQLTQTQAALDVTVKKLTRISMCLKPDAVTLPDGRVMEFSPPAGIVRQYWTGLTNALKEILA